MMWVIMSPKFSLSKRSAQSPVALWSVPPSHAHSVPASITLFIYNQRLMNEADLSSLRLIASLLHFSTPPFLHSFSSTRAQENESAFRELSSAENPLREDADTECVIVSRTPSFFSLYVKKQFFSCALSVSDSSVECEGPPA